jgi:hypothetical protein
MSAGREASRRGLDVAYSGDLGGKSIKSGGMVTGFTDRDVSLIDRSLPPTVVSWRRELLPQILRDWSGKELKDHMQFPRRAAPERRERMVRIRDCTLELARALGEADEVDIWGLADMMVQGSNGPNSSAGLAGQAEFTVLNQRIAEMVNLLKNLGKAADQTWKYKKGRPRNAAADLVLMDIVAIFEWLTDTDVTRPTDEEIDAETDAFWCFAAAIWPVVFGDGEHGLYSAIKRWSENQHGDESALMVNINMRHPGWGLSAPDPENTPP